MISRLLAALLFWGWAFSILAQPHWHIESLHYTTAGEVFDWTVRQHGDDEVLIAASKPVACIVDLRSRIMDVGQERRRFDTREAAAVLGAMAKSESGLRSALEPVHGALPALAAIEFQAGGGIKLTFQGSGSATVLLTWEPDVGLRLNGEASSVPPQPLFVWMNHIFRYASESMAWWDAGEGEPVTPEQIKA